MRRIDAVLFDLDDTLHDDTMAYQSAARRVAAEVAAERGIDADAFFRAYADEADGFWNRLSADDLRTSIGNVRRRLWTKALTKLGIDDEALATRSAEHYNAYRHEYFALYPGAAALLRALRASGKRLGLVTNGFAETHHDKIATLKIRDAFDAIFVADEVGMVKPDPRLFVHACKMLGVAPEHAAMVGDRYERDMRGAIEAGLFTIWVNTRKETLPPGAPPPDATVPTINDVIQFLP